MAYKDSYEGVLFEKKGHIAYITLNNPSKLNALSYFIFESLNDIFDEMKWDRDVWAVIMTGAGRSFAAGADLSKLRGTGGSYYTPEFNRDDRVDIHRVFNKISYFERPVVCAINGYCLGGGAELALCCDFRIASTKAKIGYPEVNVGGIAAYAGITRAARVLDFTVAKQMLYTGKHYTAEEALRMGFVQEVVEPEDLIEACERFLTDILDKSPMAVKYTKIMMERTLEMSYEASLEMERTIVSALIESEDFAEGQLAFKEKRKPSWKNN